MVVRIVVSTDVRNFCWSAFNFDLSLIGSNEVDSKRQKRSNSVCSKFLVELNKIL